MRSQKPLRMGKLHCKYTWRLGWLPVYYMHNTVHQSDCFRTGTSTEYQSCCCTKFYIQYADFKQGLQFAVWAELLPKSWIDSFIKQVSHSHQRSLGKRDGSFHLAFTPPLMCTASLQDYTKATLLTSTCPSLLSCQGLRTTPRRLKLQTPGN